MADIENLKSYDPFQDTGNEELAAATQDSYVHIRIQQRNGRKSLTTVQGLPDKLDLKKILKAFKKVFSCNGCIVKDPELGAVLQVQGDQRKNAMDFLVKEQIVAKDQIKVHGF